MNLIKYVIYLKTESINQFTKVEETNNNLLGIASEINILIQNHTILTLSHVILCDQVLKLITLQVSSQSSETRLMGFKRAG